MNAQAIHPAALAERREMFDHAMKERAERARIRANEHVDATMTHARWKEGRPAGAVSFESPASEGGIMP